jgi:hypothetical protein
MRISLAFAGFALAAPFFLAPSGLAQQESSFQPRFIAPDRDSREGFCRLRVRVDNVTDVIMFGDRVVLRTLEGRPSFDEGSECSAPLPRHGVIDFDFRKTEGPGRANVMETPDRGEGRVVIHVSDPEPGDHKYTLEFRWRSEHREGWGDWDGGHDRGFAPPPADFGPDRAIGICQDAVKDQIWSQYHFRDAEFAHVRVDEGRQEWIVGEVVARHGEDRLALRFECNVDYRGARVRSARVWEREKDGFR